MPMMNLVRPGAISATVWAAPASTEGMRPKGLVTAGNRFRELVALAARPIVTKVSRQIIWLSSMPAPSKPAASTCLIMSSNSGMGEVPGTRMEILIGSAIENASSQRNSSKLGCAASIPARFGLPCKSPAACRRAGIAGCLDGQIHGVTVAPVTTRRSSFAHCAPYPRVQPELARSVDNRGIWMRPETASPVQKRPQWAGV